MDELDRKIINRLQRGFPVCERPFLEEAGHLGCSESELMTRLQCMLDDGLATRFGPLYHAERLGGALCLCAMAVPVERFEAVAEQVNAFPEVAHNYERDHRLNMWFVLATEQAEQLDATVAAIEQATGLKVWKMPKLEEFYVGLYLEV